MSLIGFFHHPFIHLSFVMVFAVVASNFPWKVATLCVHVKKCSIYIASTNDDVKMVSMLYVCVCACTC